MVHNLTVDRLFVVIIWKKEQMSRAHCHKISQFVFSVASVVFVRLAMVVGFRL